MRGVECCIQTLLEYLWDTVYKEKIKAGDVFCMNYDIACEPLNLEGEKFMHGQIAATKRSYEKKIFE